MVSPDSVIILLEQYGYIFLFLIAVVEGPIITIIAAFLAAQGFFNIYLVYAIVLVGDLAGDVLYYSIGRFARLRPFAWLAAKIGMTTERFALVERAVEQHGGKMLLIAKYSQTGFLALPAAGAARMPMGKFLAYNLAGSVPKSFILVLVGWFFGYAYNSINSYLIRISLVLALGAILVLLYFFLRHRVKDPYGAG